MHWVELIKFVFFLFFWMTKMHTAMYEIGERWMVYVRKMYTLYVGMKILETCELVYHAVQKKTFQIL